MPPPQPEELTDLAAFLALYKRFGIDLRVESDAGEQWVALKAGAHPKLDGYMFFFSVVSFDAKGKFIKQEFGE